MALSTNPAGSVDVAHLSEARSGPLRRGALLMLAGLCVLGAEVSALPSVTNISAAQREDNTGLVDISYDLSGGLSPMTVWIDVSFNDGETWVSPPPNRFQGAVGDGISNGDGLGIVWDAGIDYPNVYVPNCRVRITAVQSDPEDLTILLQGNLPLVLVRIPAGTFTMGSPQTERSRGFNEVLTTITLTEDFWMSKYPLTDTQFSAIFGENYGFESRPFRTIPNVASELISVLSDFAESTEQLPPDHRFRLPTEAEWEYACRAGTSTRFYFGDSLIGIEGNDGCEDDGIRSQFMWYCGNSTSMGASGEVVGQKTPNSFGLYDMHGNGNEMTLSITPFVQFGVLQDLPGGELTNPRPYSMDGELIPVGVDATDDSIISERGGNDSGHFSNVASSRSAYRGWNPSATVRLVLVPESVY